jgi:hypothetical protein
MSEKGKSASPSAIQVKNRRKTISIEEKLHVTNRHEKGERIVDIHRNARLTHSSVHTICDNADRIKESAKSGTNYQEVLEFKYLGSLVTYDNDCGKDV